MKDKMKNTLEQEVELLGRSVSVLAITALLIVGGASAATVVTVGSISGTVTVEEGLTFESTTDSDFSQTAEAGSEFTVSATLENHANTKTNPMVEVVTISNEEGGDLSHRDLDAVEFESYTTHDPSDIPDDQNAPDYDEDNGLHYYIRRDDQGDVEEVETGGYLTSTTEGSDVVVCVADETMTFATNEAWEKTYTVDPSTSFSDSDLTVDAELINLYDRETGDYNDEVTSCEQFDSSSTFDDPSDLY